eukprot:TRINITY_DN323_c0_g2_i1.p1 TRINITY_DN323_c0_g2~~TRINITY_DN323_c0_g2_i1.p1  ORF type:complete len:295 (-),score=66.10 TRINITY_DN323_c0_g2_i1:227-1111(-)
MNKFAGVFVVVAFVLASSTFAYNCLDGGCQTIEDTVQAQTDETTYAIGDHHYAAMYLQVVNEQDDNGNIKYNYLTYRGKYYPKVDDFSVMRSPGSGSLMESRAGYSSYIFAEVNGKFTCKRPHYKNKDEFLAFYTIVTTLENGKIDLVEWSDGAECVPNDKTTCEFGAAANCTANYCDFANIPICNKDTFPDSLLLTTKKEAGCPASKECEVKIYLAYIGDDKNGDPTTSTNLVFSNFQSFGVDYGALIASASELGASLPIDDIPIPDIPDIPDLPDIPDTPDFPDLPDDPTSR